MKRTRKKIREETGLEPEKLEELARTSPAVMRHKTLHNWTHEETVEWVYKGMKAQHQKMLKKNQKTFGPDMKSNTVKAYEPEVTVSVSNHNKDEARAIGVNHNCTGSSACFGCEQERRDAYKNGANYYA